MRKLSELQIAARLSAVAFAVLCSLNCWANPVLPTLFSDHMVLQWAHEITIWGTADPAEGVSVSLAGHSGTATANTQGKWNVRLPAMTAGGPFTLAVQGKTQIIIKDVMIGEVWLASGQSNMTFSLDGSEHAATDVPEANYPQIRLFTVPKKIALSPQQNTLPAHWEICTPDTAKTFSAVAYFFARDIYRKLNVPVGIVESAWPGTAIEHWIAPDVLHQNAEFRPITEKWDSATAAEKQFAQNGQTYDLEFDDFELIPAGQEPKSKTLANFDDGGSGLSTGGSFSYSWRDAPESTFELFSPGRGGAGFSARVSGQMDGANDSILAATYRADATPADLTAYAGIRFWVRGNGSFRFRSKQPDITDYDDYATPLIKASPEWKPVTVWFRDLKQDGWGVVKEFTPNALTGFSLECLTAIGYGDMPVSGLYEGMITPLLGYQFRGALWYQGESNALRAYQYRKLLPALISNWRDALQESNLEFLIVQLPNHGAIPSQPGESAWAELREAELMTVEQVLHTGLAVTIDVGDPKNLHPPRKREVGERLALWALGTTYNQPIEYSGPLYQSMANEGNQVRIHFSHVGSGLIAHDGGELQGFAIAGADHKFHWAHAQIDGDTVLVSSPTVPRPVSVRYAWGDSPVCNLFNKAGLPASPFRTDDWPGITKSARN